MTDEYITRQCQLLSMSKETYLEECKSSLRSDSSEDNFTYSINEEHFCIKKRLETPGRTFMKIKFGSIKLQQVIVRAAFGIFIIIAMIII